MKILVCISGASLINVGIKLLNELNLKKDIKTFAIFSKGAKAVLKAQKRDSINLEFKNIEFFKDSDISAPMASGSFGIDKTIVAPCSINTLAKIANGICDTLITRACAVSLKEQKKLILGVREMPLSTISLEQMSKLSSLGVCIAPPIISEYCDAKSVDDLENFIAGKWLDILEIENNLYKRWR